MGERTGISWTEATWNPVTGCTKVSPGCTNCYAERITQRWGQDFSKVVLHPERLAQPFHWRKPRMIFTCSMSDLFHREVPWQFLVRIFDVMAINAQHTYQILTKRPGRMAHFANMILSRQGRSWPPNVWAGTSVESAKYLPRLDVLARVPAPVRFVSAEPLLGSLCLRPWLEGCQCDEERIIEYGHKEHCLQKRTLDWVIVGGESGPGYRPMNLDWVRSIRDQCQAAHVPFHFKQGAGLRPGRDDWLDGCQWKEVPHAETYSATAH